VTEGGDRQWTQEKNQFCVGGLVVRKITGEKTTQTSDVSRKKRTVGNPVEQVTTVAGRHEKGRRETGGYRSEKKRIEGVSVLTGKR